MRVCVHIHPKWQYRERVQHLSSQQIYNRMSRGGAWGKNNWDKEKIYKGQNVCEPFPAC